MASKLPKSLEFCQNSRCLGPALTAAAIGLVAVFQHTPWAIPNPPSVLLLAVVYSSFAGGMLPGLLSGLMSWLYIAWFFSLPDFAFNYHDENFRRVLVWGITIPLTAFMVGRLKRQHELALKTMEQRVHERTAELAQRHHELQREMERRLKVESQLLKSRDEAEAANRAKSHFLANMSHEIRTPLGAVLGFSELLLSTNLQEGERQHYAATIKRNGSLLSRIINDILDFSKIEAGKLEIHPAVTEMREILSDLYGVLRVQAEDKGLSLNIDIDPSLPSMVTTDAVRLRQIILNVVGNAIKFTERGVIDVEVQAERGEDGTSTLSIVVRDQGPGVRAEIADKIFQPFSQGDASSTRRFNGAGLGLPLARRLAEALGGDVRLLPQTTGRGASFQIRIKVTANTAVPYGQVSPSMVDAAAGEHDHRLLAGLRILLVEDAPDNQLLVSQMLRLAGANVAVAANGKEGMERALHESYDVLLMDLQMPIMDGYEATRTLRQAGYQGPIIALTAHALQDERTRCLSNGFDDHLVKPIDYQQLLRRIAISRGLPHGSIRPALDHER